jgi:hypothetical protein
MKKITAKWLTKVNACFSDEEKKEFELIGDIKKIVNKLIKLDRLNDACWLITSYMNKMQRIEYAIFSAKQVLHIFEEKYPDDNRPRKAIEATEKYLKSPTKKNNATANTAAYSSAAAAFATTDTAATAAYAAANTDYVATAVFAANAAVDDAVNATTNNDMKIKIIKNGLKIIYREEK